MRDAVVRPQFSLRTMLLAVVVVGLALSVGKLVGVYAGVWVAVQFLVVACIASDLGSHKAPTRRGLVVTAILVMCVTFIPVLVLVGLAIVRAIR